MAVADQLVRMRLSRRELLRCGLGALACPILAACSSAEPTAPEDPSLDAAVTVRGDVIEVDVTRVPQWRGENADDSAVVFLAAQLIVVRRAGPSFSALSAVCPHSGCGVSVVQAPRLVCPCHGSEFDFAGRRLAGPAPTGLTTLVANFDGEARVLRVQRPAG